jgi:hypothetical protein
MKLNFECSGEAREYLHADLAQQLGIELTRISERALPDQME